MSDYKSFQATVVALHQTLTLLILLLKKHLSLSHIMHHTITHSLTLNVAVLVVIETNICGNLSHTVLMFVLVAKAAKIIIILQIIL